MKCFDVKLNEVFPCINSDQDPTLTCFISDKTERFAPDRKKPAILIFPGGGYWCVCDHREGDPIAFNFLKNGFDAFVLRYSIAPKLYPQQLLEATAAISYIRAHADEWKIDANKIAVTGYSAGGHLAGSLGVLKEEKVLEALNVAWQDVRPNAMVLGYPVISSNPEFAHQCIYSVTGVPGKTDEMHKKMSLEHLVDSSTPPTYIWHTAEDTVVPVMNTIVFGAALAKNKIPFEMHVYPYGPHGLATADYASNVPAEPHYCAEWIGEAIKFLKTIF
ncbi:MAG: alpha/beta hydrolase [Clostridia bacterium]|nr:alpha/beta hydrolase [Clostridia bacterium]